jgi:acyl carrier protein
MNDSDLRARLVNCFQTVFPDMPADQVAAASQDSVEKWDSVAGITLISVIEDEFSAKADLERMSDLTSFAAILAYLREAPTAY